MLRQTVQYVVMRHAMRRNFAAATSAMKRALPKSQLQGQPTPTGIQGQPTPTGKGGAPPPPVPPSDTSFMIPVAVTGLLLAGGLAYYLDVIPGPQSESKEALMDKEAQEKEATTVSDEAPKKSEKVGEIITKTSVMIPEEASEKEEEVGEMVIEEATTVPEEAPMKEEEVGEKVIEEVAEKLKEVTSIGTLAIQAPSSEHPPAEHLPQSNLVSMKPLPSLEASVEEAVKELEKGLEEQTSATLAKAHKRIRATFNESLFSDLDQMSAAELRVRVVQLATEMEERTKWEAVRLKEFLAMKEKEVADKCVHHCDCSRLVSNTILMLRELLFLFQVHGNSSKATFGI